MADPAEQAFVQGQQIISAEVDGGFMLLNPEDWTYLQLDDIGGRIWSRLVGPLTLTALVDGLLGEYSTDAETCRTDTERFLLDLAARGFVESQAA